MSDDTDKQLGIIKEVHKTTNDAHYKEITFTWGKKSKDKLKYFPDRRIGSVAKITDDLTTTITEQGMSKKEIELFFPNSKPGYTYNRGQILNSLIYEGFIKDGLGLDEGNVRHFWYTHLKHILVNVLGEDDNDSVNVAINKSWGELIDSALVTYEGMNITGGKESGRISYIKDSPFNNVLIGVEKQNFFDTFKWLPQLFNCTLMTAGGQPSRAVTYRLVLELKELGVDLNQDFYLCTASDYDPSGYDIQENFRKQFEAAIRTHNGTGNVKIRRLFVKRNQLTDDLIAAQAIPYGDNIDIDSIFVEKDKKRAITARKKSNTQWNNFVRRTMQEQEDQQGGLYVEPPPHWVGDTVAVDGQQKVRAIIEMDVFTNKMIEQRIIRELLAIIRETNDESKIMIPEIMRVFDQLREKIADDVYDEEYNHIIKPLKQEFTGKLEDWEKEIEETKNDTKNEIKSGYDGLLSEKERDKLDQEPELFDEKYWLKSERELLTDEKSSRIKITRDMFYRLIEELVQRRENQVKKIEDEYKEPITSFDEKLASLQDEIDEACKHIDEEIERLKEQRDIDLEEQDNNYDKRKEKLDEFKEEHLLTFNPAEETLKSDIKEALNTDNLPYRFKELENHGRAKSNIAKLLTVPEKLFTYNQSCFEQEKPAFKCGNLLEQASINGDLNIGTVRNAFTNKFIDDMQYIIKQLFREKQLTFEAKNVPPMEDLEHKIQEAKDKVEQEIQKQ